MISTKGASCLEESLIREIRTLRNMFRYLRWRELHALVTEMESALDKRIEKNRMQGSGVSHDA